METECLGVFSLTLLLSCECMCECVCVFSCVWAHEFFFSAGGDLLHCQLLSMMLNSNRNTVSRENDFILFIPLFPSDCLFFLRSLVLSVIIYCIASASISVCLSTFVDHFYSSYFLWLIFLPPAVSLFYPLPLTLSAPKILWLFVSDEMVIWFLREEWSNK